MLRFFNLKVNLRYEKVKQNKIYCLLQSQNFGRLSKLLTKLIKSNLVLIIVQN